MFPFLQCHTTLEINSLSPGKCGCDFKCVNCKQKFRASEIFFFGFSAKFEAQNDFFFFLLIHSFKKFLFSAAHTILDALHKLKGLISWVFK